MTSDDDATLDGPAPGATAPSTAPTRVGPYVVQGELGRGGMGIVYRAHDERLDRPVALKALPRRAAEDADSLGALHGEARALASINDPNVATLHGLEETEGSLYLVMELVEGRSLAQILADGALPRARALGLAAQVASGLAAVHARGIAHCDLKPSNVRVTPSGIAKIVDFGLARRHAGDEVEARRVSGTPGYMAPEQVSRIGSHAGIVDTRADSWSFGCLLFELLAGRRAVPGITPAERIEALRRGTIQWDALPPGMPDAVTRLLRRCLDVDPVARPADGRELRECVMALLDDAGELPTLRPRTNLPRGLSSFVGRTREVAEVEALLPVLGSGNRLVTLAGAGGCGKTRLAIEVASRVQARLPDGAWLVELAGVTDPLMVPAAVADALGVEGHGAKSGESVREVLRENLRGRHLLVILDNCEHLLDACASLVGDLLAMAPEACVLATSREPLGLPGEAVYRVPSLALPPEDVATRDALLGYDSARLFVDRARLARPGFDLSTADVPHVARACRRLDGIPLAIELAASRLSALTPLQVVERLDDRFRLLVGGRRAALPRQQALLATLDWSHDLLTESEALLFRRLGVFAGGFTLEDAERTCAAPPLQEGDVLDLLARLVDKSLVACEERASRSRYRLLETIREYAHARLAASGESTLLRRRHRDTFAAIAEEAERHVRSPDQGAWLDTLEAEHDNLRAALDGCFDDPEGAATGLRLAASLRWFWEIRGHRSEGRRRLAEALTRPCGDAALRARGLHSAGALGWTDGDAPAARPLLVEALSLYEALGDETNAARVLDNLGNLEHFAGDQVAARALHERALVVRTNLGDVGGMASSLTTLGLVAIETGDLAGARRLLERALELRRTTGDARSIAFALGNLAMALHESGERAASIPLMREAAERLRALKLDGALAAIVANLGRALWGIGDSVAALPLLEDSSASAERNGDRRVAGVAFQNLALAQLALGRVADARRSMAHALPMRRLDGVARSTTEILDASAAVAVGAGLDEEGTRLHGAAAALRVACDVADGVTDVEDRAPSTTLARERLGPERHAALVAEGAALGRDEAIELALRIMRA